MFSDLMKKMENSELLSDIELDEVLSEMDAAGNRDREKNGGLFKKEGSEMMSIWNTAWNNVNNGAALHKKVVQLLYLRGQK